MPTDYRNYRAPWSKPVKIATYATNIVMAGICLTLTIVGLSQLRIGQPIGWVIMAGTLPCWLFLFGFPLWAPRSYYITDAAIQVCRKIGEESIPFERIASIQIMDSHEIFASAIRIAGSGGYYGTFGTFSGDALSSFRAIATNDGPLVVLRMKHSDPIVLSPETPNDFARELSARAGLQFQDS